MAKINFTKVNIEKLPIPANGYAYHYDVKTRGLAVRISPKGTINFLVYRKINGKPERIPLGRYPDLSIEKARGKAGGINSAIAEGENPADKTRQQRKEMKLGELFKEYIDRHAKPNKRTWQGDEKLFHRHIGNLANKKLATIERNDIAKLHGKISKTAPITANRFIALLSSVFSRAIEWGYYEKINPSSSIRRNPEKSRDRFLQSNELKYFFDALSIEPNEIIKNYLLTSLLTGARRSNVIAMRWKNINFERAEWRIEETKNGSSQTVPLSPEVVSILLDIQNAQNKNKENNELTEFVFPGSGKTGHLVEPKKGWHRIKLRAKALGFIDAIAKKSKWNKKKSLAEYENARCHPDEVIQKYLETGNNLGVSSEQYDISDLRIHDLRRTLGSWQAKAGASLSVIGKSLNHKSVNTTAIYARLDLDPVRESIDKATSDMLGAAGLKTVSKITNLKTIQNTN